MRIALVHDYLVQFGGAERVLDCLSDIWPHAPIYTLLHDPSLVHHRFDHKDVRTSFLQHIPFAKTNHRLFPPLMMLAIEQFNFNYYDIVLSDSSSFAKNIVTGPNTLHISYCHTPMRYAWDDCQFYTQEFNFPRWIKKLVPFLMNYIRTWDFTATYGVDELIANSNFVASRIQKYYHRASEVIHPPVDVHRFTPQEGQQTGRYYLMVGRMMRYKKMDLVVKAFNELQLPLKIVGRGMEYDYLRSIAGPTVEFLGRVSDKELVQIYAQAKAFIFPQEEDFGIVAIEALASGRPVVAFRGGDIVEHIEEGKTGIFFDRQTHSEVVAAIRRFETMQFDHAYIRQTAFKFDQTLFKEKMRATVEKKYEIFQQSRRMPRIQSAHTIGA